MNLADLFKAEPHVRTLCDNEALFVQGESGSKVYILLDGVIDIVVDGRIVEIAERGAVLGEMALIDKAPRSASAIARSVCRVAEITYDRFLYLVSHTPNFALQVMKIMSDRIRNMDESIVIGART